MKTIREAINEARDNAGKDASFSDGFRAGVEYEKENGLNENDVDTDFTSEYRTLILGIITVVLCMMCIFLSLIIL